jgi:hypothetical protein
MKKEWDRIYVVSVPIRVKVFHMYKRITWRDHMFASLADQIIAYWKFRKSILKFVSLFIYELQAVCLSRISFFVCDLFIYFHIWLHL